MNNRVSYKDYYKAISLEQNTGDIWLNLPSLGLLKRKSCSGLIITPACDLANNKVETLTYLPIISINEYFASRSFYPIILTKIISFSNGINDFTVQNLFTRKILPTLADIEFLINEYDRKIRDKAGIINKIISGLKMTHDICNNEVKIVNKSLLLDFFSEKDIYKRNESIIQNSFSSDLHFLPKDERDEDWTAIKDHSLALFRYPITVPIEILEFANDSSIGDWSQKMEEASYMFPIAPAFKDFCPLKVYTLHPFFLSDLLTRFAGLYIRIGSPDFDRNTINQFIYDI
jgi:hypothetical protein